MVTKTIPLEYLAYHLGPKAIQHFDKGTKFLNYTGREYPANSRLPILRLGVFGSAFDSEQAGALDDRRIENVHKKEPEPKLLYAAKETGKELAKQNQVIVTGACGGIPYEVIKAAKAYRPSTLVIGISPAPNEEAHLKKDMPIAFHDWIFYAGANENKVGQLLVELGILADYDAFSFTDRDNRNIDLINGAAFIAGGSGTGHELMGLWEAGKTGGLIEALGGVSGAMPPILEEIKRYKSTGASYISESNPRILVQRLVTQTRLGMLARGEYRIGSVWIYRSKNQEVYIHVKEFELNSNQKKVPDVTSPLKHGELRPEYALITTNHKGLEGMIKGFGLVSTNERLFDGNLYEAAPRQLKRLRKSLHAVGATSPNAIGLIEHVRASERPKAA